jgi:hypothetical protein
MRHHVIVVLCFSGVMWAACSGSPSSVSSSGVLPPGSRALRPPGGSPTPTPIPFQFQTVDDPNSNVNEVTGINQLSKIVGVYEGGSASNIPESYTAQPPYSKFRGLNYPGAQGTFATSLSSNKYVAGYVINPPVGSGIWGFIRASGIWSILNDPNEGTGGNAVTELLGINDSQFAVGFYQNNSGTKVPFELNVPTLSFTDLTPPGATNAEATGINGKGNISGWEQTASGFQAFYLQTGTYYPTSDPKGKATFALSLNWQDQLVGYYLDSSGVAHGFLLTGPTRGGDTQVWQTVDAPKGVGGTWVTGINNHDDICGYYIDGSGVQHGFVAIP